MAKHKFDIGQIVYSAGVKYLVKGFQETDCGLIYAVLKAISPEMDHSVYIEQDTLVEANKRHLAKQSICS